MGTYVPAQTFKKFPPNWSLWCCRKLVMVIFFLSVALSFALPSTPLLGVISSKLSWVGGLSLPSWFCPKFPLSSIKMSSMAELVMNVDPEELALWSYGKGKRRPRRLGVGERPFQVQTMTRKLPRGSSRGSWGEELNLSSVASNPLCDLGRDQNSPQKNGSYIVSACQRGVLFQTLKHYIKKKKWDPGEGRKKGAVSREEVTRFMKLELFKVVLGTVSRGSAGY